MRPLEGLRILDFSRVFAGPFATQIMAELGAEVFKIERPGGGDETRAWEPRIKGHEEESAYFFALNRAKKSITLNLKQKQAQDIARRLAAEVDVVIENFPTGSMAKFGLGYEDLSKDNPGLIYLSNTGFGQTGPYAKRKGYDPIFQAMSGLMDLTGEPDGPPTRIGVPVSDLTSGLWAVIAILTGAQARTKTGKGCFIDLSMFDAQIALLSVSAGEYFATGKAPTRIGAGHLGRVPSSTFKCADGRWLQLTCGDQHWEDYCRILELDDLWADEALRKNSERVRRRDEVTRRVAEAIASKDRDALMAAMLEKDLPAGPINSFDEVMEEPVTKAREMVQRFEHPAVGGFDGIKNPLRFKGVDDPSFGRPPLLGEHTDEVLAELLGMSEEELKTLREEGTI